MTRLCLRTRNDTGAITCHPLFCLQFALDDGCRAFGISRRPLLDFRRFCATQARALSRSQRVVKKRSSHRNDMIRTTDKLVHLRIIDVVITASTSNKDTIGQVRRSWLPFRGFIHFLLSCAWDNSISTGALSEVKRAFGTRDKLRRDQLPLGLCFILLCT